MKSIIISHSDAGEQLAQKIQKANFDCDIYRSPKQFENLWEQAETLIFIGSLGICVRTIAPFIKNKKTDPAVINIDPKGQFVQSVISGHIGGGNATSKELSRLLGASAILSTVSDSLDLWALDLLPKQYNWKLECKQPLTQLMAKYVNKKPTALLIECRDQGCLFLESSKAEHIHLFYKAEDIKESDFDLIIAVTPFIYSFKTDTIYYRPAMLQLGLGAQKSINSYAFEHELLAVLEQKKCSYHSIKSINTVDIKAKEQAFVDFSEKHNIELKAFDANILSQYSVPNPSEKVKSVTGSYSVSEAAAMQASNNKLHLEKTKFKAGEKFATVSIAIDSKLERKGFVEIVGAGPGDPELISVKGKRFLQTADLILYAGSLVPKELTHYAKAGCKVESSAGMNLEEQIKIMSEFYNKGLFVVRLHTGDPCIYGAIQEQMDRMDKLKMDYHITPGISSFQAAASALKSQFTIPEEVQTIILTRGAGRTPMPDREQLSKLSKSQSTMCIYLSASIAKKVQNELLEHYPPETPVAVCYKLTWKEEKIWRAELKDLAKTVEENNLKMTTMIVVGKAIGNRSGESKLYHKQFTHAFREGTCRES